jgi:hypothetical protein
MVRSCRLNQLIFVISFNISFNKSSLVKLSFVFCNVEASIYFKGESGLLT